jgi:hypothetical protein
VQCAKRRQPELYAYEEKSRRPFTILALAISIAMFAVAVYEQADWYFYIPVVLAAGMLAWMVTYNRVSGARLNQQRLQLYAGSWQKSINVSDIAGLRVTRWSKGAPALTLKFHSGTSEMIPGYCVGDSKSFCAALQQLGVPIT